MATIEQNIQRWKSYVQGGEKKPYKRGNCNVFGDGDSLYSYGYHFTLAEKHDWGFLLNADRNSVSTARHQRETRSALEGGITSLLVPFEAIDAASIDHASIEVIDQLPDRNVPRWIKHKLDARQYVKDGKVWRYYESPVYPNDWHSIPWNERPAVSTFPIERTDYEEENYRVEDGQVWRKIHDHFLGEAVFAARVYHFASGKRRTRKAYFISAWDRQDTRTYFLSELPRPVTSLDDAYEALKPETVRLGEKNGRTIVRQGDIFAVETELTKRDLTKMGATYTKMSYVLGTNHTITELAILPNGAVLGRGILRHKPPFRDPDHRTQKVATWSVLSRNTVPLIKQEKRAA